MESLPTVTAKLKLRIETKDDGQGHRNETFWRPCTVPPLVIPHESPHHQKYKHKLGADKPCGGTMN